MKIWQIVVLGMQIALIALLLTVISALLSACGARGNDFVLPAKKLIEEFGKPVVIHDEWYWCQEGAHGYKQLMKAKVVGGVTQESMQFMVVYEGSCGDVIEAWADKQERIE
jgi:hypothetical protein